MKFSIVIPTYNSATIISRALDSIVCQLYSDWEVLIVDGASTDETVRIAQSYNDSRIRIYSEPDDGIYDAMNKGIINANGEWLYFLGSDDWLLNENVLSEVAPLLVDSFEVVYGDVEAPQLSERYMGEWTIDKVNSNRCHQAIFYRNSLFKRNGLYNIKYKVLADYAFNLKWFLQGEVKSKYINKLIAYHSGGGVSDCVVDEDFKRDAPFIFIKYGRKKLPVTTKKAVVWQSIPYNSNRPMIVLFLRTYLLWLKIVGFVSRNRK